MRFGVGREQMKRDTTDHDLMAYYEREKSFISFIHSRPSKKRQLNQNKYSKNTARIFAKV